REQHTGLGDDVAPRLEPELASAASVLDLGERAVEGGHVERPLPGTLRHAESAAEIEIAHVPKALEHCDELLSGVAPRLRRQHAAPGMGVQPDDLRTAVADEPLELVGLEQRHAELRMRAGRAHVLVMAPALAGIDSDENLRAAKQLRPVLERIQIVERQ